jgi:lysophospholipase L1-like esterase
MSTLGAWVIGSACLVASLGACDAAKAPEATQELADQADGVSRTDADAASADAQPDGGGASRVGPCEEPGAILGRVYWDQDQSDQSAAKGGFGAGVDAPIAGVSVGLLSPGAEVDLEMCADGSFVLPTLADGVHVLAPELPTHAGCPSRNCVRRFPEALREGKLKIVTFGDSIAVVGDKPLFPARLATLLKGLAEVEQVNVAVSGSYATEWLPGDSYFERNLLPVLDGADVVLATIGGNDVLAYTQDPALLNDLEGAVEGAKALVNETIGHLLSIRDAIHQVNPEADLVYCLYPNYGQAVNTYPWDLVGTLLGEQALVDILQAARDAVPSDGSIILADLFGAADGLPLDDYLYDELHFNAKGHVLYAETIFVALGGVLVGPSPLGAEGTTPLGIAPFWGLEPSP